MAPVSEPFTSKIWVQKRLQRTHLGYRTGAPFNVSLGHTPPVAGRERARLSRGASVLHLSQPLRERGSGWRRPRGLRGEGRFLSFLPITKEVDSETGSGDSLVQKQRADEEEPDFRAINGGGMNGVECVSTEQGTGACTCFLPTKGELRASIISPAFQMFTYSVFSVNHQPRSWAVPLSPAPPPPTALPSLTPATLSVPDGLPFSLAQGWPSAPILGQHPSLKPPRGRPFSLVLWSPRMWARDGVRLPSSHTQCRLSLTTVLPDPA